MVGHDLGLVVVAPRAAFGPPLDLDFVQGLHRRGAESVAEFALLSGTGFSRAGAGAGLTTAGAPAWFATGVPRVTDRGLLLEGAATNLNLRSQGDVSWAGGGTTPPAVQTSVSLDGRTCASATFPTGAGGFGVSRATSSSASVASGVTYTVSFFAKFSRPLAGGETVVIYCTGSFGGWYTTIDAATAPSAAFRRFSRSDPAPGAGTIYFAVYCNSLGSPLTVYMTDRQCEAGGVATSPILTTGAALVRGADAASVVAPAGVSTWTATYGVSNTVVGGTVTPGATFDLVAGRPWIGLGAELKRLVMG